MKGAGVQTGTDEQNQELLDGIERIAEPRARRIIGGIAQSLLAGRLNDDDMQLLAGIADRIADRSEQSLNEEELSLVRQFRKLNQRQRQGVNMLLSAAEEINRVNE